jgi:hypothetical protein
MQNNSKPSLLNQPLKNAPVIGGIILILTGLTILADIYLKTGWLSWIILLIAAICLLTAAILSRRIGLLIVISLVSSLTIGGVLATSPFLNLSTNISIGTLCIAFSFGWLLVTFLPHWFINKTFWWAFVPALVLFSFGMTFLSNNISLLGFVLSSSIGLGVSLLIWGITNRLFGLLIAGSLVITTGPGVFIGWHDLTDINGLSQTGEMLVCIAFGWGLITVLSRLVTIRFVWWPLIPGGIIAMVGCGLYIGGNPGGTTELIRNTGAVGLIIFGLYILLMRRGLKK